MGPSVAVDPATAWSTADRVSSGPTASRLTPSADATKAVIATARWRIEARKRRRIQPGVGASCTGSTLSPGTDTSHPSSAAVIVSVVNRSHCEGLQPRPVSTP